MAANKRRIQGDVILPDFAVQAMKNLLNSKISRTANANFPLTEYLFFRKDQIPNFCIDGSDKHILIPSTGHFWEIFIMRQFIDVIYYRSLMY